MLWAERRVEALKATFAELMATLEGALPPMLRIPRPIRVSLISLIGGTSGLIKRSQTVWISHSPRTLNCDDAIGARGGRPVLLGS